MGSAVAALGKTAESKAVRGRRICAEHASHLQRRRCEYPVSDRANAVQQFFKAAEANPAMIRVSGSTSLWLPAVPVARDEQTALRHEALLPCPTSALAHVF